MGTFIFLVFITATLASLLLLFSRTKTDTKEYPHGQKSDSSFPRELLIARKNRQTELPRAEAYVDWYMRKLEDVRCEKERRKILAASSTKDQQSSKNSDETADSENIELAGLCHTLRPQSEVISIRHRSHRTV